MWWPMSIQRKLMIGLVLFLSILILWYQLRQRNVISKLPSNVEEARKMSQQWQLEKETPIEPFGIFTSQETDMANELTNVSTPLGGAGKIQTYNLKSMRDLPLKEFIIKSSYNSACTGNFMNKDMIKYVLSRGCRFIDMQLYYSSEDQRVYVSSFMPDNITKTVKKDLSLDDALNTINTFAFAGPSPNLGDPLFIQFRFNINNRYGINKYKDTMVQYVANTLNNTMADRFYGAGKQVDIATKMSDIMGKFVIVSDTAIVDKDGVNLVNMQVGNAPFPRFTSQDVDSYMSNYLVVDPTTKQSNTNLIRFVEPVAGDSSNLPGMRIMNQYTAQVVEQMYWRLEKNLTDYETMFFNYGTAFVPLYLAKDYFTNLK